MVREGGEGMGNYNYARSLFFVYLVYTQPPSPTPYIVCMKCIFLIKRNVCATEGGLANTIYTPEWESRIVEALFRGRDGSAVGDVRRVAKERAGRAGFPCLIPIDGEKMMGYLFFHGFVVIYNKFG